MAEDLGEKTEDPTGKRIFEARDKGQVARSADLSAVIIMICVCIYLVFFGGGIAENLAGAMRGALEPVHFTESISVSTAPTAGAFAFERLAGATLPLLAFIFVIAAISQFLQVGWHLSAKQMQPKLSNLSPAKGLKKTFSQRNAIKSIIDIGKVTLVLSVGALHLALSTDKIAALPLLSTMGTITAAGKIVLEGAIWILFVLLLIGIADMIFQKWQHTQELRMSKHEVKEERKSAEGDPQVKARRFRMMQELLRQQINAAVPQADVIVTNPTHFSVALKYDPDTMSAPRVLAKGADHLAFRIRTVAKAAGVPIVERPPLARALYYTTEPGQQIPLEHFEAVAELLAYIYRLDQKAAS